MEMARGRNDERMGYCAGFSGLLAVLEGKIQTKAMLSMECYGKKL